MTGSVKAKVRTNATPGSVCKLSVEPVKFDALWKAYPSGQPSQAKDAQGNLLYTNQCAIKVSVALHRVGVEMKSFAGAYTLIDGKRAALRAEELASWLSKMPFCGLPRTPENITGADWKVKAKGRTGIIFLADYWARSGESNANASGDHIDLWNGSRLTDLSSWVRVRFGISVPGYWSDYDKAKRVLFFPIL